MDFHYHPGKSVQLLRELINLAPTLTRADGAKTLDGKKFRVIVYVFQDNSDKF